MSVYTVFHTEHKGKHFDEDGDVSIYGKNTQRFLGAYASQDAAAEAVERMKLLPGFRDEPNCFVIDEEELDEVGWKSGFTRG